MSLDRSSHSYLSGLRVRISANNGRVAHITPLVPTPKLQNTTLLDFLRTLQQNGVNQVFTSALRPREQAFFEELGFVVHEELLLLGHDFSTPLNAPVKKTRKGRRSDWNQMLEIDASAFSEFWRFDKPALLEAIKATPTSRIRVDADNEISGFAITGRSGRTAFLQRLAVDPRYQRTGLGRSLVADALQWSKRWFVNELLVNTQIGNIGAQKLYESMGFNKKSDGLAVLKWNAET